jgi:hypothetical protein
MTQADQLRASYRSVQVNEDCSEAALIMIDGSQLGFCHRVGERWAKAIPGSKAEDEAAGRLLETISLFRLNGKHLDIQFADGSRWELPFGSR